MNICNMYILYMGLKNKKIYDIWCIYNVCTYIYIVDMGHLDPRSIYLSIYPFIHPSIHPSIHSFIYHPWIYLYPSDFGARIYTRSMYVNVCVCVRRWNARVHKVTISSKLGSNPKVSECKGKLLSNRFNRRTSPWHPEYSCQGYIEPVCQHKNTLQRKETYSERRVEGYMWVYLKIYI